MAVRSMIDEISQIKIKSNLPEQYYLSKRLKGWRQINPCWNMEVGPLYTDPGFTWPKASARSRALSGRGKLWRSQETSEIKVFHFSGLAIHPWWYADLSPEEAFHDAVSRWRHRDPRRLVAASVREWVTAMRELQSEVATWPADERDQAERVLNSLRSRSSSYRAWAWWQRSHACEFCGNHFFADEGRRLHDWEGWFLCEDCIIGYIQSDLEPPPACTRCGRVCDCTDKSTWRWNWVCEACDRTT